MEIRKVKIRFEKWKHTTDKAYLVVYRGKEVWLPQSICWNLKVAGNDLHAWAEIPAFKFKELTGHELSDAYKDYGVEGMRNLFDAVVNVIVEKHVPERKEPVESNYIKELKKHEKHK